LLERHRMNNDFAAQVDAVTPRLTNGAAITAQFTSDNAGQYYRIDVPAGMSLQITLTGTVSAITELYLRQGAFPTRGTYDYHSTSISGPNQQITVMNIPSGTWYVLAYGASIPNSDQYTISVQLSSVLLSIVSPALSGTAVDSTLILTGAGFLPGSSVELISEGGAHYPATTLGVDSFTRITAIIAAGSVPAGSYTVRVTRPDSSFAQLNNVFTMIAGGLPKLVTNLILPKTMGRHAPATIYVEYSNTGSAPMPAPLLVLTGSHKGVPGAFLTLNPALHNAGFWTSAQPAGFSHSVQFLAGGNTPGTLQPGESFRVPVYYAGWQYNLWDFSDNTFNWNLGVMQADDPTAVDWASMKDDMRPSSMAPDAWNAVWSSFVTKVGTTWGNYLTVLDNNASYLSGIGRHVTDLNDLLAFEFLLADGMNLMRSLAGAVDASVPAPGLPLTFSRSFGEPISQRYALGVLGRGWSHNWQYSLTVMTDGTVTVHGPTGSQRTFQPDSRNTNYFAQIGDYGQLHSLGGGAFSLQETDGHLQIYRPDGTLDYVQDSNSNRIYCSYSGGQLSVLTHSAGQSIQIAYNFAGRIQTLTDSLGRQTDLSYDGTGEHLVEAQYYDGRSAIYTYNTAGSPAQLHALTGVASSCCNWRYFNYDALGSLVGTHLADNAEALTFSYGNGGQVTVTDALGNPTQFFYDHRGLLAKTQDALGNEVRLSFDDLYNLVSVTDPSGHSYNYGYDSKGNLTQSTDPLAHVSQFTYQPAFNRLASVTDARGNATRYGYDSKGNLQSITYADGSTESWISDSRGSPQTWINRRGHQASYTYNNFGQVTAKHFADGSMTTYAYDSQGNLTNAATFDTSLTLLESSAMSYDGSNRLARITYPGGKYLAFTYDSAGRRLSSTDQLEHALFYSYDTAGRLSSMTNELNTSVVQYQYDSAGRVALKTLGNGMFTTYQYDPTGQLLSMTNALTNATILSSFNYSYDSRGRRSAMNTLDGNWTYTYDDVGQLIHAVYTAFTTNVPNQDLTYGYDSVGNRTETIENGVTNSYVANNLNQYVSAGQAAFTFDGDGNLIREVSPHGTNTYVYSDENRLTSMSTPQGNWQYSYDGLGKRLAKAENGATTRYVIDPAGLGNVVGEYNQAGNLVAHYDHAIGLLARIDAVGNSAGYTFDALGNVQQMMSAAGTVLNSYAYAPFGGSLKKVEIVPNPFQFVGGSGVHTEGSSLVFMRARFLASDAGRFTQPDPIGIFSDLNRYSYSFNSPLNWKDPNGLDAGAWTTCSGNTPTITNPETNPRLRKVFQEHEEVHAQQCREGRFHADPCGDMDDEAEAYNKTRRNPSLTPSERQFYDDAYRKCSSHDPSCPRGGGGACSVPSNPPSPINPPKPVSLPGGSGTSGVTGSTDPNDKIGPVGYGVGNYVSISTPFSYRVDFENSTNATAPAQQVVVTDQLSTNLDWPTFQLGEVGWGDVMITIPPNMQHFETNGTVSYLGTNFQVQVEAGIQFANGQVYATFRSIDPASGLPPPVSIGFLPPEDNTGRGQGHITYIVSAKTNLKFGTEIRNVAYISFDNQPYISTDQIDPHDSSQGVDTNKQCLNTMDTLRPWSSLTALPAESPKGFWVSWAGGDQGSGIDHYDVFSQRENAGFHLWQSGVTNTAAFFDGEPGVRYSFFSVAHDRVGLTEAKAMAPVSATITEFLVNGLSKTNLVSLQVMTNTCPPATNNCGQVFTVQVYQAAAVLSWESATNLNYDVYWTGEPTATFEPLMTNLPAVPPVNAITSPAVEAENLRIFRVQRQLPGP
jgi:RHS repeat-associated protein